MPHTIALVDDDSNILASVTLTLETEGFFVRSYTNGVDALKGLIGHPADLAILDVKMPRMDGIELLGKLRKESAMPVIFLSAQDEEVDQVFGFRVGADDYIKKPFSQRVLVERIRALLRRSDRTLAGDEKAESVIERGVLHLDSARHQCTWKGQKVDLTVTEFMLMRALAVRPGQVKSRNQLLDCVHSEHIDANDRAIDSHVKRLRNKFKCVDRNFARIETLYGVGYRYQAD